MLAAWELDEVLNNIGNIINGYHRDLNITKLEFNTREYRAEHIELEDLTHWLDFACAEGWHKASQYGETEHVLHAAHKYFKGMYEREYGHLSFRTQLAD